MAALGLAIMIVAGVVTLDVVLENTRNTDASIVGQTVSNVDLGGFLVVGVLIGVAFMFGVMLLLAGLRRASRRRQERRELERSVAGTATQAESLQEERDRLAAELEEERRARHRAEHATPVGGAPAAAVGASEHHAADHHASDHLTAEVPSAPQHPVEAESGAPVYPTEQATGPISTPTAGTPTAGTATQERAAERTKPTLKQRLLGS